MECRWALMHGPPDISRDKTLKIPSFLADEGFEGGL